MTSRARVAALVFVVLAAAACKGEMFKPYEYEEELYLSLDGSGTLWVHSSAAALVALRGAEFDIGPRARLDAARLRAMFTSPTTEVRRVTSSRRSGRLFVHVRMAVKDVRALSLAGPFAWSRYQFEQRGDLFVFEQHVGPSAGRDVGNVGWNGGEVVGFRIHLPSKIPWHNAPPGNLRRGNILVWEQALTDRLAGKPLLMTVHMETESILYRTLWLFGLCLLAVALTFAAVIWWVMRKARVPVPSET